MPLALLIVDCTPETTVGQPWGGSRPCSSLWGGLEDCPAWMGRRRELSGTGSRTPLPLISWLAFPCVVPPVLCVYTVVPFDLLCCGGGLGALSLRAVPQCDDIGFSCERTAPGCGHRCVFASRLVRGGPSGVSAGGCCFADSVQTAPGHVGLLRNFSGNLQTSLRATAAMESGMDGALARGTLHSGTTMGFPLHGQGEEEGVIYQVVGASLRGSDQGELLRPKATCSLRWGPSL